MPRPNSLSRPASATAPRTAQDHLASGCSSWLAIAVAGWLLLSLILFMVSAQFEQDQVSDQAKTPLDGSGPLPSSANTVLVIGSDARPPGTHEGGANVVGQPSRAGHAAAHPHRRRRLVRASRSPATRSCPSRATGRTRSTPPTRSAARR